MADYGNSNRTPARSDSVSLSGVLVVLGVLVLGLILLVVFTSGSPTTPVDDTGAPQAIEGTAEPALEEAPAAPVEN